MIVGGVAVAISTAAVAVFLGKLRQRGVMRT
jgi:hypothetical protein